WLLAVHEDDRTRVRAAWDHALATFEPFDIELRLRAPDHGDARVQGGKRHGANGAGEPGAASHRWYHVRANPRRAPDDGVIGWLALAHDIEARKRSERLHDALALASSRLTESLEYDVTLAHVAEVL